MLLLAPQTHTNVHVLHTGNLQYAAFSTRCSYTLHFPCMTGWFSVVPEASFSHFSPFLRVVYLMHFAVQTHMNCCFLASKDVWRLRFFICLLECTAMIHQ